MFIVVSSLDVAKKCWFESEQHTGYHTIRYIHSVQYTCTVFIVYKMIKLLNSLLLLLPENMYRASHIFRPCMAL